ncbi:MAG: tetratricopeptide repeat protein [Chloroflexi bacterium]|nr:tetratricopeptide repeat protein [Chloroflexota bacterium]
MFRVFVSSTSQDLQAHREAVRDAVLALGMHPVMMEHFPAMDADAVAACHQKVQDCDLFVGIYAHRYGYIPHQHTRSITELEYDWAGEAGIPRRVFVIDPDHPWPDSLRDPAHAAALDAFKQRVGREKVWATFTTPESLAARVSQSLAHDAGRVQRERQQQRRLLIGSVSLIAVLLALISAAVVLSRPDDDDSVGRLATAQAVAALNQTATAAAWTPTPTATPTLLPTATPLEGDPARTGEIVVVVAPFERTSGSAFTPEIDMLEVLRQAAAEAGDVRVIGIGHPLADRAQAQQVSDLYGATMVVYGRTAPGGVTAHYEITPRDGFVDFEAEGEYRVSTAQLDNFEAFLYEGMDVNYILGLTAGQLHYFEDDLDGAVRSFSLATDALDPRRADDLHAYVLYFFRGNCYAFQEAYDQAVADYDEALRLNPDLAEGYVNRGLTHVRLGRYEQAIADYDRALAIDPAYINAYHSRAEAAYDLGRLGAAIDDYTRILELDPGDVAAYQNRGLAYHDQGLLAQALDDYNHALALAPDDADLYANRALVYADRGDFENALADVNRAIDLDPQFALAYGIRGALYYFQGDRERALADLREYARLAGDEASPDILAILAELEGTE